jgi:hypothetical protein
MRGIVTAKSTMTPLSSHYGNAREPASGAATERQEPTALGSAARPPTLRATVRLVIVAAASLLAGALIVSRGGAPRSDAARAESPSAPAIASEQENMQVPPPMTSYEIPEEAVPSLDAGPSRRRRPPKALGSGRPFMPSNL